MNNSSIIVLMICLITFIFILMEDKMNILIVGCGKVGSELAALLDSEGHDVSVVDKDEEKFNVFSDDFGGFTISGVPIDQDVLKHAGIENADVVLALTEEDNVNIMVAQLAKEFFKVPRVLIRIFDPSRGEIYSHFGFKTICPTNITIAALKAALFESDTIRNLMLVSHMVTFNSMETPKEYIGERVSNIELKENEILYAIERDGRLILVGLSNPEIQKGDKLIFSSVID